MSSSTLKSGASSITHDPGEAIDLGAVVETLWVGRLGIAGTLGLCVLAALAWLAVTPPTYQADALLQINSKTPALALPSVISGLVGDDGTAMSELQILHSRLTLGSVVADLHLDWSAEPKKLPLIGTAVRKGLILLPDFDFLSAYARPGDAIGLEFLNVPPQWVDYPIVVTKTGDQDYRMLLPDGREVAGRLGILQTATAPGFALKIATLAGAAGRQYVVRQIPQLAAIAQLDNALSASEQIKGSGVVTVTMTGTDPDLARRTLDGVLNAFEGQNLARSSAEAAKSLDFVQAQIAPAEDKVHQAEKALNDYRIAQKSVDLNFETQSLLAEIESTEGKLRDLSRTEETVKQQYTPEHPVYKDLLDTRKALQDHLDTLTAQASNLPETQKDVLNLTRDLTTAQATYDALLARSEELSVMKASTVGNVRIVDTAATALAPVAPRRLLVLLVSVIAGLVLGSALVLLRNKLRGSVDSVATLEAMGLPVFATVSQVTLPAMPPKKSDRSILMNRDYPELLVAEEFKSLRTSLHFAMLDSPNRSIAFTSGRPGAGKSFISAHVAASAAENGMRVCLVDADMRRGLQRLRFGFNRRTLGLSEFLAHERELEDVIYTTDVEGLDLLPSGKYPPNPSELLMRGRFGTMLKELTHKFDLVVIDTPPVLQVTDASVICRSAGTSFLVVRHEITPRGEVETTRHALGNIGVELRGAILNGFNPKSARGFDAYRYEHGAGYRYADESSNG